MIKKKTHILQVSAVHSAPPRQIYRLTSSPWEFCPCRSILPSHPPEPPFISSSAFSVWEERGDGGALMPRAFKWDPIDWKGGGVHFICLIRRRDGKREDDEEQTDMQRGSP